jgi:hypothetical protein
MQQMSGLVNRNVPTAMTAPGEATDVRAIALAPDIAAAFSWPAHRSWNASLPRNLHRQDSADHWREPNEDYPGSLLPTRQKVAATDANRSGYIDQEDRDSCCKPSRKFHRVTHGIAGESVRLQSPLHNLFVAAAALTRLSAAYNASRGTRSAALL